MSKSKRWREYQRLTARLVEQSKGGKQHMKIDVVPFHEALLDARFGDGAANFLWQAFETAMATTDDRLTCFCCCQDWAPYRVPVGCLTIEFLLPKQKQDAGLLSGICRDCLLKGQPEIMKAIRRDFPMMDDMHFLTEEGHA